MESRWIGGGSAHVQADDGCTAASERVWVGRVFRWSFGGARGGRGFGGRAVDRVGCVWLCPVPIRSETPVAQAWGVLGESLNVDMLRWCCKLPLGGTSVPARPDACGS